MKLQKVYTIILGLALIAPQASLQATVPGKTSWVSSLFSLGAKTITLPLTTLSFCYRNLFAGAVLAGVASWGYWKYVRPQWSQRQTRLAQIAPVHAKKISDWCENPGAFQQLTSETQTTEINTLHSALVAQSLTERFCSWIPTSIHAWLYGKFGLTSGRSAHYFFEALKKTTQVRGKRTDDGMLDTSFETIRERDPLAAHHCDLLKILNFSKDNAKTAAVGAYNARAFNGAAHGEPNSEFTFDLPHTTKA